MQLLIGNEMDSDANRAVHLSLDDKSMVNKTLLVSLSFFTIFWWITVDMLVISVVEMCFQLGFN